MSGCTLSFVIPVLNEQTHIVSLLDALARQFPDSERVVVDGGSVDQTVSLAEPRCTHILHSEPGRARQMNAGAAATSGRYIFFLHADSFPSIGVADLTRLLSGKPRWGFFRVRLSGGRPIFRIIEGAMNIRSRLTGVATGDQMLFLQRDLMERSGGFADIPLMEDIEICKRLRRICAPLVVEQRVLTSSRRWENRGVARTLLQMWVLRLAYALGVPPQRLWQHYYGH